ncbi:unnamed protein product [Calicophoron daubneyi]|uniref:DZF domain-containing protein n=1 Tax=Calicophoron daubneyi TaxID=300641 RepID=A0AAV2T3F2_CALDB
MMHPRSFQNRHRASPNAPFVSSVPFDLTMYEPDLCVPSDDRALTDVLLQHYTSITPSSSDQQGLTSLVNKTTEILEAIIVNPTEFLAGQLEEVRVVGSFKFGTWLAGHKTADLVIVFRTLPTAEASKSLQDILRQRFKSSKDSDVDYVITQDPWGFSINREGFSVRVFLTTTPRNMAKSDPAVHVDPGSQKDALSAIKQSRWLEENASHTTVKVLTRILKDMSRRFRGFQYLSSWMISLLAYYAVVQNPTYQIISINLAFRRCLQLLAGGLFLPNGAGLVDPCEPGSSRLYTYLSATEQDDLSGTAQTLLRALNLGVYNLLFTWKETSEGASRDDFVNAVSSASKIAFEWACPVITEVQEGASMRTEPLSA